MMKKNILKSVFIVCLFFQQTILRAQSILLDTSFDGDGKVTTDVNLGIDAAFSIAVQPDGKIIVAGATLNSSSGYDFCVVRYNTDGSLDPLFGSNGKVTTVLGTLDDYGRSVAIQPDGKIVVAGTSRISTGGVASTVLFAIVRYNTDGSLDTTFSTDGMITVDIATGADFASSMSIADGKIVVSGSSIEGGTTTYTTIRLNAIDGSLDPTFSTDGKVMTLFSGSNTNLGRACAIQPDGKIVVGGSANSGLTASFGVIRYNTNGALDPTFSTDGKATIAMSSVNNDNMGIVIQPDGKIVLGGNMSTPAPTATFDFAVARFNADGSADTTFDGDGKTNTPVGTGEDVGNCIALQPDGKILVGGFFANNGKFDFALIRYNANGSLDTSFDTDGKFTTPIGASNDKANAIAIQQDGKIILAGNDNGDFALVRLSGSSLSTTAFDFLNNHVKISPNPATSSVTIEMQKLDNASVEVSDISGRKLFTQKLNNVSNTINIGNLASGTYFFKVNAKQGSATSKVVKN
jgi:uncharacterized delta-60 repeat protein